MSETEIEIEQVLKYFRDLVGAQAQEIAVLKATLEVLQGPKDKVE